MKKTFTTLAVATLALPFAWACATDGTNGPNASAGVGTTTSASSGGASSTGAASTGAQKAIDCERGQEVTMVGTLRSVECNGKGCAGGVKAELFDGTDTVMLVWLGQRRIPGIESGRTLKVHGRVGKLDNGSKAIYNPHYEIQK